MPFFGNSHVNKPLTNISLRYNFENGIFDQVFPIVPVKKESDIYFIYDLSNLRLNETLRANHAKSNEIEMDYSQASYNLDEHALNGLVTQRDRDNADAPLSPDIDLTETLEQNIQIRQEVDTANLAFTTTSWSNSMTGLWAADNNVPLADVLTMTSLILQNGHVMPNRAVLAWDGFKVLKTNTSTADAIKYVERKIVTPEIIASLWDLDKVIIGKASYVTTKEGVSTIASSFIWSDKCLIYYVPQSPKLKTPSAGYTLQIGEKRKTKKWPDPDFGGDRIEVSTLFTSIIVATAAGAIIASITAAA